MLQGAKYTTGGMPSGRRVYNSTRRRFSTKSAAKGGKGTCEEPKTKTTEQITKNTEMLTEDGEFESEELSVNNEGNQADDSLSMVTYRDIELINNLKASRVIEIAPISTPEPPIGASAYQSRFPILAGIAQEGMESSDAQVTQGDLETTETDASYEQSNDESLPLTSPGATMPVMTGDINLQDPVSSESLKCCWISPRTSTECDQHFNTSDELADHIRYCHSSTFIFT